LRMRDSISWNLLPSIFKAEQNWCKSF